MAGKILQIRGKGLYKEVAFKTADDLFKMGLDQRKNYIISEDGTKIGFRTVVGGRQGVKVDPETHKVWIN